MAGAAPEDGRSARCSDKWPDWAWVYAGTFLHVWRRVRAPQTLKLRLRSEDQLSPTEAPVGSLTKVTWRTPEARRPMRNDVVDPRVKVAPWIALIIAMLTMLSLPPSAEAASYSVPTGIKATSRTASTISLAWNTIPNAPRYRVRYATKANLSDSVYRRTYDPKYTLTSLKPNTTYHVKVRVISADGTTNLTPYSPPPHSPPPTAPPTRPPPGSRRPAGPPQPSPLA